MSLSISASTVDSCPTTWPSSTTTSSGRRANWYAALPRSSPPGTSNPAHQHLRVRTALTGPEVIAVATSTNTPSHADAQQASAAAPAGKSKSPKKTIANDERTFRFLALLPLTIGVTAGAQKIAVGIAPVFDGGGEELRPTVAQHSRCLSIRSARQPLRSAFPAQSGGVYSPLDTAGWSSTCRTAPNQPALVATLNRHQPLQRALDHSVDLELLTPLRRYRGIWSVNTAIDSHKTLMDYGRSSSSSNRRPVLEAASRCVHRRALARF